MSRARTGEPFGRATRTRRRGRAGDPTGRWTRRSPTCPPAETTMKKMSRKLLAAALLLCAPALDIAPARAQDSSGAGAKPAPAVTPAPGPQKFVKEGVEIEFTV